MNTIEHILDIFIISAGTIALGSLLLMFWLFDHKERVNNRRHEEAARKHFRSL